MRRDDFRNMVKDLGRPGFVRVFADLLEGRDQNGAQIPKVRAEDLSLRALWEGLVGPIEDTLPAAMRASGKFNYLEMSEAVESTSFPSATGVIIASKVIEGYNQVGMIGDELCTVMPSRLKSE